MRTAHRDKKRKSSKYKIGWKLKLPWTNRSINRAELYASFYNIFVAKKMPLSHAQVSISVIGKPSDVLTKLQKVVNDFSYAVWQSEGWRFASRRKIMGVVLNARRGLLSWKMIYWSSSTACARWELILTRLCCSCLSILFTSFRLICTDLRPLMENPEY